MRWSLRRGNRDADGRATTDAPSAAPSGAPAADPGWRAVPPIAATWGGGAPLTAAPLTPRPPLTALPAAEPRRTPRVRPLDRPAEVEEAAPEPGRVTGLAAARPVPLAPVLPAAPPVPYLLDQPPLRHAPARPLVAHPNLTEASDDYVGEPVAVPSAAPAPPPAPPAPTIFPAQAPPRSEPAVEAATEAGARFREALANLHRSGLPRYVSPSEMGTPPAPEPPTAVTPAPPAAPPSTPAPRPDDGPPLTHRRHTLAQSRRLGLGAPVRPGGEPGAGEPGSGEDGSDGAGDAEPARASAPAPPAPAPLAPQAAPAPPPPPAADGPGPRAPLQPSAVPARPLTGGAPSTTTVAAPLIFRARPPQPEAPPTTRTVERAVVTRPPADLARSLQASHGIDVRDVEVRRDTAADHEARQRGARAFTRGARVFLPQEAGSVDTATTRALLAHELVHAAQQRRLGGNLPPESSPEGRALEAEAQAAEHAHGGPAPSLTATDPLRHAPAPVSAHWVDDRITQHALDLAPPPMPLQLSDQQLYEVRYAAQEVIRQAAQEGAVGGDGTGVPGSGGTGGTGTGGGTGLGALAGLAGGTAAATTMGIGGARTPEQLQDQLVRAINLERQERGLPTVNNLSDLSRADQELIRREMGDIYPEVRQQQMREELRHQLGLPPAGQQGGTTWTPQTGFQRTGATGTGTTTGQTGTGTGTGTGQPTLPPGVPAPTRPGGGALGGPGGQTATGVGIGQATNREAFLGQALMAVNLERHEQGMAPVQSIDDLPSGERALIEQAWDTAHAQVEQRQRETAFTQQLRQQASTRSTTPGTTGAGTSGLAGTPGPTGGPTPGTTAATTAAATAATTAHATAQARDGHHMTTGNATSAGHDELSLESINLTELSDRLYDRLRSRLRTELLIDRERAGLLTDFR